MYKSTPKMRPMRQDHFMADPFLSEVESIAAHPHHTRVPGSRHAFSLVWVRLSCAVLLRGYSTAALVRYRKASALPFLPNVTMNRRTFLAGTLAAVGTTPLLAALQ